MAENKINKWIHNPLQEKIGEEYFNSGYVYSIQSENNRISTKVGILSSEYTCSFDLENKEPKNLKCSCGQTDCAHLAASLYAWSTPGYKSFYSMRGEEILEVRKQEIRKENYRNKAKQSNDFITRTKNQYHTSVISQVQSEKYDIIPTITVTDGELEVGFKVGSSKTYVIKSIPTFLENLSKEQNYKYGKNLEFVHTRNAFTTESQKIIDFMEYANSYYSLKQVNNRDFYYYNEKFGVKRTIPIDAELIDLFYDYFVDMEIEDVSMDIWDKKIELTLKEEDDFYIIESNISSDVVIGKKAIYRVEGEYGFVYINRMELDNNGTLTSFLKEFENGEYILAKEDYPDFYKYLISPNLNYLECKHFIEQGNTYDQIKLYGDVDENGEIYFNLYYYDDNQNRIRGFNTDIPTTFEQDIVENYIKKFASRIDPETKIAYFDLEEENSYTFVNEGLEFLNEYANVYVTDALKKIGKKVKYSITVGVGFSNDLLQVDIESDEIPKNELSNVLAYYKKKKKFYRLKNGKLLYLESDDLEELETFMDQYHINPKDVDKGKFALNAQRIFSLEQDSQESQFIQFKRKSSYQKMLDKFDKDQRNSYIVPEKYDPILRDYQKDGYKWMRTLNDFGFNGILADDMGLGKTLQVITLLESLDSKLPSLVVCPASLIYNWDDEIKKFSSKLDAVCIVGNKTQREECIQNMNHQLYITSYDYLRRDIDSYEEKEFNYCILDEAQNIKNQKTKNAISVKSIQAQHRLALTGTPIENTLAELWSIFDFLMPQYLFNYSFFRKEYESNIVKNSDEKATKRLQKLVSPFILRRNKKEVLTELPDKIEKVQYVSFTEEEKELYFANLAQMNIELQDLLKVESNSSIQILALLTKLRQICLEPRMIYENIRNASSKIKETLNLVRSLKANHQKVLIFSSFPSVFQYLEEEFKLDNISYHVLTGSTLKEDRRDMVKEFQEDNSDVFLISLKAGGTGLNLTSAQAVIHLDPWWNVSAQNQATDRAYRIGQKQNVQVYNMVVKGSIEEKIIKLQEMKKELADTFVEGNHGSISTMSKEEIQALFTFDD
ncbi:MAG: DEAD/DEAH box helicase [Firmicutes bacterium]|nr:DEAD/DEAH box helicase [Bacillota bacterium]